MTRSALSTSQTPYAGKATKRRHTVSMFIVHHAATTSAAAVKRMFGTTAYQVSAHYIVDGSDIVAAVPEELRAWTSGDHTLRDGGKGADLDHRAITVETVNSSMGEPWPISEASHRSLVALAVDLHRRYGLPLDRDHVVGHGELYTRWRASYQTRCPGGIDLDRIVRDARAVVDTPPPTIPEEISDMADYSFVRPKGDPRVFLSVNRQTRRHLKNEAALKDARYVLKQAGIPNWNEPVAEVANIDAFGVEIVGVDELVERIAKAVRP